jgi:hypothetical protein
MARNLLHIEGNWTSSHFQSCLRAFETDIKHISWIFGGSKFVVSLCFISTLQSNSRICFSRGSITSLRHWFTCGNTRRHSQSTSTRYSQYFQESTLHQSGAISFFVPLCRLFFLSYKIDNMNFGICVFRACEIQSKIRSNVGRVDW